MSFRYRRIKKLIELRKALNYRLGYLKSATDISDSQARIEELEYVQRLVESINHISNVQKRHFHSHSGGGNVSNNDQHE
ncbi:MAG: hypothetical protein IBX64_02910 [Actinobacteria bacterium]|nr:hypothetical protein [Actinomycetota bacterium]